MEETVFFIFGIQNKEKEIAVLGNIQCKNCDKGQGGKLIKTYNFFHFFFIRIFKWNEKYYVICNGCSSVFEIPKDKGKDIERGAKIDITYWDLKPANENHYGLGAWKCNNCGREVRPDYDYCPYCGVRIK